jgi:hypothetical protein
VRSRIYRTTCTSVAMDAPALRYLTCPYWQSRAYVSSSSCSAFMVVEPFLFNRGRNACEGLFSTCFEECSREHPLESELVTPRRARSREVNPDQKPKYDRIYVPIENAKLDGLLPNPNGRLGAYKLEVRRIFLAILSLLLCSCASISSPTPGDYTHNRCSRPGSGDME